MRAIVVLVLAAFCFSFCPSTEDTESGASEGYYILVQDYTNRTFHKYIVESRDSVDIIFNTFFDAELALGKVDRPISINNGKRDFYIARVVVFEKPGGRKSFKNLKYPPVYANPKKENRRSKLEPVYL